MNAKIAGFVVLVLVICGAAALFFMTAPSTISTTQPPAADTSVSAATTSNASAASGSTSSSDSGSSSGSGSAATTYTMADIAQHNGASSCWAAINGKVYDLTSWINQHPGGPEHILAICGTDGSAAFNAQHGGQSQPAAMLATFYIGALAH